MIIEPPVVVTGTSLKLIFYVRNHIQNLKPSWYAISFADRHQAQNFQ
jgi:hypothetical protein